MNTSILSVTPLYMLHNQGNTRFSLFMQIMQMISLNMQGTKMFETGPDSTEKLHKNESGYLWLVTIELVEEYPCIYDGKNYYFYYS